MKKEGRPETGAPILAETEWQALKAISADVKKDDKSGSERFIDRKN
jgi:hypothetical protein